MNFLYYFIRYTIVRNLNRLLKPKTLLVIGIVLLIIFFSLKLESNAVYNGNTTYTDPNSDIFLAYNSIANDLLAKISYYEHNTQYDNLINYLNNKDYGYYIYYGNYDGSSMLNGMTYEQDVIRLVFYDLSDPILTSTALYTSYQGIGCNIRGNNSIVANFTLDDIIYFDDATSGDVCYMPSILYNYRPNVLLQFLDLSEEERTQEIITALNEQTNTIQQQTNTIQQQNDFLQQEPSSIDFDNNDLPSDSTTDTTTSGLNSIFTMFYDEFTRDPKGTDIIEVVVPFTNKSFYIPYTYTANYVPTTLKNLINSFWYFVVSVFIVKDIINKFQYIKSGNLENMQNDNIKGDLL